MKKIIIGLLLAPQLTNGMDPQREAQSPQELAATIERTILKDLETRPDEQIIQHIKQFLNDDSLATSKSLQVKEALTKLLSEKELSRSYAMAQGNEGENHEIVRTMFYDNTSSLKILTYYFPVDNCSCQVLSPKPASPWLALTFNSLLESYRRAEFYHKQQQCVPLLTQGQ